MRKSPPVLAICFSFLYCLISIVWVLASDRFLYVFLDNKTLFEKINTFKGLLYIVFTSALLFGLLIHYLSEEGKMKHKLQASIRKQEEIKDTLNYIAYYDKVTSLPNRNSLYEDFKTIVKEKKKGFILIKLNVNQFRTINEINGHTGGDEFLSNLAERLNQCISLEENLYHLDSDEFVVLLMNDPSVVELLQKIRRFQEASLQQWRYGERSYFLSVNMGIVKYPQQGFELEELLKNADIALVEAKRDEKNNYCIYSTKLKREMEAYVETYNDLYRAIINQEFFLLYQPIMDLFEEKIVAVEALIRWKHPQKGIISPGEFIPIAESTGLINAMGSWVMQSAFVQKKKWEEDGIKGLKVSINISGISLMQKEFLGEVQKNIEIYQVNQSEIQFEITESTYITKITTISRILHAIRKLGILIALDDFGTGYSSFNYLKKMPIDVIKLDAEFISGIIDGTHEKIIFDAMNQLTHKLGMKLIAEGIETEEENQLIRQEGCDYGQGYLYSRPCPAEQIPKLLKVNRENSCCIT